MQSASDVFHALNTDYLAVHKTKEDLFWATYMATSTDDAGFSRAEESYKNFISDPARLTAVRGALASLPDGGDEALRHGLKSWQALIECNVVESDAARVLMSELVKLEPDLFAKQREHGQRQARPNLQRRTRHRHAHCCPFRICSIRNQPPRITATCSRKWPSTKPAPISNASTATSPTTQPSALSWPNTTGPEARYPVTVQ